MDTSTGAWRRWIWIFVVVQLVGLVVDAAWHGLLSRGVEPESLAEMVSHLATVHLPLYIGVLGLFVTAIWAAAGAGVPPRAWRCRSWWRAPPCSWREKSGPRTPT